MTPAREPVTTCHGCPSHTGKQCGHAVLYGVGACWKRDGRPERCVGLNMRDRWKSEYAGNGDDCEAE